MQKFYKRKKILHLITSLEVGGVQHGLLLGLPKLDNKKYEHAICSLTSKMPMGNETIYHKTAYDFSSLKKVLEEVDFKDIRHWNWEATEHSEFDDHSQAYYPHMDKENGTLISLNMECVK